MISMILSSLVVATTNAQINHGGLDVEFDNTLVLSETNGLVFYWSYQPEENEDVSMALRCLSSACEGYFAIGFNDVSISPPYMINSHAIIGDCMVGNVANIHEYYLGGTTESQVTRVASTLSSQSCDVNESITTLRFSRPRIGPNYSLDVFGNQSQTIIYAIGKQQIYMNIRVILFLFFDYEMLTWFCFGIESTLFHRLCWVQCKFAYLPQSQRYCILA